MNSSGYSNAPLYKKLGIKPNNMVLIINAPKNNWQQIYHKDLQFIKVNNEEERINFIHLFTDSVLNLKEEILSLKEKLDKDGMLWVSWVKKSSRLHSGVDGNQVRFCGLEAGLVDIKVAAIDENWSGLKFVYRKSYRK